MEGLREVAVMKGPIQLLKLIALQGTLLDDIDLAPLVTEVAFLE